MGCSFYDPSMSYQENYLLGPFGMILTDPNTEDRAALDLPEAHRVEVGGLRLRRGLGIPSGPLLNRKFTDATFKWGFDLCHYKTVRSRVWPSHPMPNVLYVQAGEIPAGELGKAPLEAREFAPGEEFDGPGVSITNSFGMPAQKPEVWQADVDRAAKAAGKGQALVASVYGTAMPGDDAAAYVADFAKTAAMAAETAAHAIEVNLSCPNLGGHGLLCHDPEAARQVARAAREAIGDRPLFVKMSAFPLGEAGDALLASVIAATAPYVQAYGAVNAVPVKIVGPGGEAALPGDGRDMAGVCGAALKPTGLSMVKRLAELREQKGYDFSIVGVGGLASPEDFRAYLEAGADAVQGATGAMWNHRLAVQIARAMKQQEAAAA